MPTLSCGLCRITCDQPAKNLNWFQVYFAPIAPPVLSVAVADRVLELALPKEVVPKATLLMNVLLVKVEMPPSCADVKGVPATTA